MSDEAPIEQPYYLRSFESPLESVYERYRELWVEPEHELYTHYITQLSRDEKLVFVKLLLRSHNNIYELGEVADRYWRILNWRQSYTEAEIEEDKKRIAKAVENLIKLKFLNQWNPELKNQRDDVNALKSLQVQGLRTVIGGLPDGKETLKKYKKKEELIVWLVDRLQKFGDVANPFTRRTFSELVWEKFHQLDGTSAELNLRFLVDKTASRFFKRLHLLNHVFVSTISPTGAGSDAISERIESILTECLKPGVLEEIGSLEYVKSSRSTSLGIAKHKPLFVSRQELENYEQALGIVQEIKAELSMPRVHRLAGECVTHLISYVTSLDSPPKLPGHSDLISTLQQKTAPSPVSPRAIQPSEAKRLSHHVFRRFTPEYLYSIALYELAQLLETGLVNDHGEKVKDHELAVQWYALILLVRATRMNRGKIYLRLLIDLRLHLNRPQEAAQWAEQALSEISSMEPGFIVDLAKQVGHLIGRRALLRATKQQEVKPPVEVLEICDDDDEDDEGGDREELAPTKASHHLQLKKQRAITTFRGIYEQLAGRSLASQLEFAKLLIGMEKEINGTIPIKVIRGQKLETKESKKSMISRGSATPLSSDIEDADDSRSEVSSRVSKSLIQSKFLWGEKWISVEQFALQNYLLHQDDTYIRVADHGFYSERNKLHKKRLKTERSDPPPTAPPAPGAGSGQWVGCHCEGSVIREIASLLLFPLVFNARVCPANADAFITDAQVASCDLGTVDFYEVRKPTIHAYLTLWERLASRRELAFLLTFLSSQLFEVRVMSATWSLDVNHPNAFKPQLLHPPIAPPPPPPLPTRPPLLPRASPALPKASPAHRPPQTPSLVAASPAVKRGGVSASLRKTPTSKWQTPRFRGRLPLRKVGMTNETNLVLGYDRGVSLLPGEQLDVALGRRLESGLAYGLELSKVACGVPAEGLTQIMLHLCKCFPYWANGLPDLLLWKNVGRRAEPDASSRVLVSPACAALLMVLMDVKFVDTAETERVLGVDVAAVDLESWLVILEHQGNALIDLSTLMADDCAFAILRRAWDVVGSLELAECCTVLAEVKGPGDALSQKQRLWLYAMLGAGINAHVCEVRAAA